MARMKHLFLALALTTALSAPAHADTATDAAGAFVPGFVDQSRAAQMWRCILRACRRPTMLWAILIGHWAGGSGLCCDCGFRARRRVRHREMVRHGLTP